MPVKLLITARRQIGQTLQAHRHHMKAVHGQLVLDYIAQFPEYAPLRYVQNHAFDGWFAKGELTRDLFTELWFQNAQAVRGSRQTQYYLDFLLPDEANMVDQFSVLGMLTKEVNIAGNRLPQHRFKVSVFHKAVAEVSRRNFQKLWLAQPLEINEGIRHVRCSVVSPSPFDGIDQFWFSDKQAAYKFCASLPKKVIAPLCQQGLCEVHTSNMLLAREYVLFAGVESDFVGA